MTIPRLVGYVPIVEDMPSFGIPIFLKNGAFCVQKIDDYGRISGFVDQDGSLMSRLQVIPEEARPISRFNLGDDAYFVFETPDKVIAGTGLQVASKINQTRHASFYRSYPFLFLEVSDFCALYLDQGRKHSVPPVRLADAFLEIRQKQALKGGLLGKPRAERASFFTLFRDESQRGRLRNTGHQYYRQYNLDLVESAGARAYEDTLRFVADSNEVGLLVCNISTEDRFGEHLAKQFSGAGLTRIDIQTPEDYQRVLDAFTLFSLW
ncbi:hypothetical protein KTE52_28265 [Burkholderia multivorans]|uniref:Uncharacterized protein n=1 Tax=Burkholderia multivorans TaxID=87883 RepID=A0AAP2HPF9_9BURK|nr:hypothetical protein [Burkholderia multivorans]MBU9360234.1 hypothetical protein [Burkholderia multivorans]HDR9017889.1 hypothetical protein [Burkholderia vietnamiensis]